MDGQMKNVYQLFAQRAGELGNAPAFFSPDGEVSYAQFLKQADKIAAGLGQQGVVKGDRVATVAMNSVSHVAVLVACAKIGAIAFPTNWRLAASELQQSLELTEPAALIVDTQFLPLLEGADLGKIGLKAAWGEEPPEGFVPFEELLIEGGEQLENVSEEDPAAIIATAAVVGVARGAVLTHGNLVSVSRMFTQVYGLSNTDRYLGVLPFFHIAGFELLVVMAMAGGASVILPGFDAEAGVKMMEQHKVSLIATFPPMLEMLMAERQKLDASWASLRVCFGILNPPDVIQQFMALGTGNYWTGYGQTETTGIATLINVKEKPGSAGKVVPGLEMRMVDDLDTEVPTGEPGEIAVRGNLVFSGYWRDEEGSAYAGRNGWHHTGDLGKVDGEGYLYYVGRKPEKELIKSGGENIYPAEVESAIQKLPEVAEVCVIGVPDEKWGETVKAVVELKSGQSLDADGLLAGIAEHLAAYKKPRLIEFVDRLSRQENGEVDRAAVKEIYG